MPGINLRWSSSAALTPILRNILYIFYFLPRPLLWDILYSFVYDSHSGPIEEAVSQRVARRRTISHQALL